MADKDATFLLAAPPMVDQKLVRGDNSLMRYANAPCTATTDTDLPADLASLARVPGNSLLRVAISSKKGAGLRVDDKGQFTLNGAPFWRPHVAHQPTVAYLAHIMPGGNVALDAEITRVLAPDKDAAVYPHGVAPPMRGIGDKFAYRSQANAKDAYKAALAELAAAETNDDAPSSAVDVTRDVLAMYRTVNELRVDLDTVGNVL